MSQIVDYNTLYQQIQKYLNRNDQATLDQIPQFIAVGESNVYRDLRVPTMEARFTYTIGVIEEDDGLGNISYKTVNSLRVPLNFLTLRTIVAPEHNAVIRPKAWTEFTREKSRSPGIPEVYARDGDTLFFDPIPNHPVEIEVLYYRAFDNLDPSNSIQGNDPRPFLQVAHDAFLYGALAEAATYLGDDRLEYFAGRYQGAVETLNQNAADLELSGGMLEVSINSD